MCESVCASEDCVCLLTYFCLISPGTRHTEREEERQGERGREGGGERERERGNEDSVQGTSERRKVGEERGGGYRTSGNEELVVRGG